jgi:hypothetical protein
VIRLAKQSDLDTIMALGKEFSHQMLYQKDRGLMSRYIDMDRILVWEELTKSSLITPEVTGFYHFIVSGDPGFKEMLRCYREMPEYIVFEAGSYKVGELCICMQGGSHREIFREFVLWMQKAFPNIWCYCSKRSQRPDSYIQLGFTFNLDEEYTFYNIHKGDESTYRLGRWTVLK